MEEDMEQALSISSRSGCIRHEKTMLECQYASKEISQIVIAGTKRLSLSVNLFWKCNFVVLEKGTKRLCLSVNGKWWFCIAIHLTFDCVLHITNSKMFAGVLCSWSDNDRKNMCYNNIFLKQSGKGVEENSRFYMVY